MASAAFRLAGVDWPEDRQFWDEVLSREWPGPTRSILNDGYAAIRCGEPSGVGVAVTPARPRRSRRAGQTERLGTWAGGASTRWARSAWPRRSKRCTLPTWALAPPTALTRALLDFYGLASAAGAQPLAHPA